MTILPQSIEDLINEFSKLPGIGPKSAQRLAFYLLKSDKEDLEGFAKILSMLKEDIILCSSCQNLSDHDPCSICSDKGRDQKTICVVEESLDMVALEKTGSFNGLYHVLHGAISPVDGIGPDELKIKELLRRIKKNDFSEVIIATNPSIEGEATAMYLAKLLKPLSIKTTRIARGLPTGGDLEYADEITIENALEGRKEY